MEIFNNFDEYVIDQFPKFEQFAGFHNIVKELVINGEVLTTTSITNDMFGDMSKFITIKSMSNLENIIKVILDKHGLTNDKDFQTKFNTYYNSAEYFIDECKNKLQVTFNIYKQYRS